MFPVSGSLLMAPPFPRSGPSESGSPTSQVVLRCYDFPLTRSRSLICSLPGPPRVLRSLCSLIPALPSGWRSRLGPGSLFSRRSLYYPAHFVWTCVGSLRFPGDPSRAFAPVSDPGRTDGPLPWRSRQCCPCCNESKGFSVFLISRLPRGFSTCCLRFMGDVATAHARLASGWLADLYREGVEPSGSRRKVSEFTSLSPFLDLS
jgi:hypothetical protein